MSTPDLSPHLKPPWWNSVGRLVLDVPPQLRGFFADHLGHVGLRGPVCLPRRQETNQRRVKDLRGNSAICLSPLEKVQLFLVVINPFKTNRRKENIFLSKWKSGSPPNGGLDWRLDIKTLTLEKWKSILQTNPNQKSREDSNNNDIGVLKTN